MPLTPPPAPLHGREQPIAVEVYQYLGRALPDGPAEPVQRFAAACESLAERWPVLDGRTAHRRGYLTVDWACVAPTG